MNFYSIRHLTRFRYAHPISESIMERACTRAPTPPSTASTSRSPSARAVASSAIAITRATRCRHFDIPGEHNQLVIVAESIVEEQPSPDVPSFLSPDAWPALDDLIESGDYWEMLLPSTFAVETPAVTLLAKQMDVARRDDPLMLVQELNERLFEYFDYVPSHTRVDSPIDEAIVSGKGVCQDFAHTMIALLRHVRIPARYVSGYLYRSREDHDRSTPDATTPGLRHSCRISAGSASIPPTTSSPTTATSAPLSAATTQTYPPPTASSAAEPTVNSTWLCK